MNRPTDKQIEEVLAGIASPEDAKYVAEWFATEEGSDYLEAAMTQDSELIKNEFADLYVDHDIPSKKNQVTEKDCAVPPRFAYQHRTLHQLILKPKN